MKALASTSLTIVGAGPAGIMAAHSAAQAGVPVTLIDDSRLPGGQYYRQSPAFTLGAPLEATLYARLNHPNIRTLYGTSAWGVFERRVLALADAERTYALAIDHAILATGATDRPFAFPGWTLPGVQGAGATLRMLRSQGLQPGKRVLLAGLGPLQLALAAALLKADVEIVAVAEAANPFAARRALAGLRDHGARLREALATLHALQSRQIPYLVNHAIVAAEGSYSVQRATLAQLDASGAPIAGTERQYETDAVCLGYGLLPAFQLAASFGCELRYVEALRGWTPRHDEQMQTSEPGIYLAGDVTGSADAEAAALQGQLAGLAAACSLGALPNAAFEQQASPIRARLRSLDRLTDALNRLFAFPGGLDFLAKDDTLLCPCEEVSLKQIQTAIAQGGTDLHQVKLHARAGMGYCQGRNCSAVIAPYIARATGQPVSALRPFTVRPPIHPVPLAVLAAGAGEIGPD